MFMYVFLTILIALLVQFKCTNIQKDILHSNQEFYKTCKKRVPTGNHNKYCD